MTNPFRRMSPDPYGGIFLWALIPAVLAVAVLFRVREPAAPATGR